MPATTTITQQHLDDYKALFPNDRDIQNITLQQLLTQSSGKVDWQRLQPGTAPARPEASVQAPGLTDCQTKIGYVLFDVVCLAVGAVGLRASVRPQTIAAMAGAAAPVLSKLEVVIARMGAEGTSTVDMAKGVFTILSTIYSGGCLGAVVSAFTASLTWWDMILYGVTATATIIAALATEGAAFVAEVVVLLATFGFLASDSVKAVQACSLTPAPGPMPGPDPHPGPVPIDSIVAIRTVNGHTLTIVNMGGLGGGNTALETNRTQIGPWEKFTMVPIDRNARTFALKTCNGNFVTAVNGGGIGGPNDASSPVHTDATWVDIWEQLMFEQQDDDTYAIRTTTGYYLTAINGGGWGEAANLMPIHTDATVLGPWETFTLLTVK
jgi:hypothetical protein